MHIPMSSLSAVEAYATMTQTIIPRPIAWILTENDNASYNLAPFSYFNALSSVPPMVVVSVGVQPDGGIKDTRHNLEQRGDCVIHIAHRELAAEMTATSASLPRNSSELATLELTTEQMPGIALPRVAQCRVAYAAELKDTKLIGQQWIAFLELTHLYLADSVIGEDSKGRLKVLAQSVDPIGRLGGGEYMMAGEFITIERPA